MNILQIVPRIPYPLNDGSAIGVYNITRYLHLAGHSVTLLALNTKKHYQPPSVMSSVCTDIRTVDIDTSLRAVDALSHLLRGNAYIVERFKSSQFHELIARTLAEQHYDAVHMDSIYVAPYVDTVRAATRAPVVLRAHNVEYQILRRLADNMKPGLRKLYMSNMAARLKKFEQDYFQRFDGILAITEEDYSLIRSLGYTGSMEIMPGGVDLSMFVPQHGVHTQPRTVFFFGGLEWAPNIEAVHWFMQHVFPAFRATFPDVEFHIGGKNPAADILAYAEKPGVFVHPNVPSAPNFMQSYDIMVVPLLSGGGMRLKIVEAMAMRRAIVSTPIGAEGIAVQHGHNILLAESPHDFLQAIAQCLNDQTLKAGLQQQAFDTVQRLYSWETVIRTAEQMYSSLAQQRRQ